MTGKETAGHFCRVHCKSIHADISLSALTEVIAIRRYPAILGGNPSVGWAVPTIDPSSLSKPVGTAHPASYWTAEPREVFEFKAGRGDPFSHLQRTLNKYTLDGVRPSMLPAGMFCGGWIGYFAYELRRYIERLPGKAVDDLGMPLIWLGFYDRVIAYDHRSNVFRLVALETPGDSETPQEKIADLERCLRQSREIEPTEPSEATIGDIDPVRICRNMTREEYLAAIRNIKRYIRDGDVYQVNFSHRFEQPFEGSPVQLFHWQNRYNPSGYAAYLNTGDCWIVSASPEMFITIRDGRIRTSPIKGTRPRSGSDEPYTAGLNAERVRELLISEKEQAELNMIIDLERNDVARICKPGTRRVIQPRTIETCPTVYHAVATIGGELRNDVGFIDVLRAMFPGGSVTGAPKIRAMEIIDELEPTARGVYTGSIGFIGLDGTVCLNIAIRTAIIARGSAFVQTGGGIVADSDPQAEWDETITKARALLAGIEAVRTQRVMRLA